MIKILKNLIPPFFLYLIKKIYFFYLIKKNSKDVNENFQDTEIYNKEITAEKLDDWGKDNVWNEIQFLIKNENGNILDLACGTGRNIIDLKKINKKSNFYGCDISQQLIDIAIQNGVIKDNLKCVDATLIDYPKEFFDYSYSIGSLEHFTEEGIDNVVNKLHHVTKIASYHMMPVSRKNINEGWIKTYQTFHNNSENWWVDKFKKKFNRVYVVNSSWNDFISNGRWFLCYKD
jgi:ubiquinone/menaquinone biosynthesis C-methylase UbiE|tara:strand:- start:367 stop:1062 length:696 start_codon:yes stop_codon:yes gene_type:complete